MKEFEKWYSKTHRDCSRFPSATFKEEVAWRAALKWVKEEMEAHEGEPSRIICFCIYKTIIDELKEI